MKELIGLAKEAGKLICPEARRFPGVRNDLHMLDSTVFGRMHDFNVS